MSDTGGAAFPVPGFVGPNEVYDYPQHGMSLRDYFAGQALAACSLNERYNPKDTARECYAIADAMIEERYK